MAKRSRSQGPTPHKFRNKLVLNQWLISLFGVDPFREHTVNGRKMRPFHRLAEPIKDQRGEGLTESNIHRFFHNLVDTPLFQQGDLDRRTLLRYEENIVRHTQRVNEKRIRPVVWKYYQWLTLMFTEIYLDRYFHNRDGLLRDLNAFVKRFNEQWSKYADVPPFSDDDLNKLCLQNATGSGKTLLMHVNLLQYQHYARQVGREDDLSRVILLTPNERLSEQHLDEFDQSGIQAEWYTGSRNTLFATAASGLRRVDVMEITKLADQDGPQQIATRSLGDQNLLLVDEGHRGMSGGRAAQQEENAWFSRRNNLCVKGFTFEYSATFEQAVAAAKNQTIEDAYAKCILFDYSYRYFYEDGFGKDYQILNLPESLGDVEQVYLTACLLKFYQQLRIYQEKHAEFVPFNLEKPLWVFVGSSVTGGKWKLDEEAVASDVARVLQFVADFLHDAATAHSRVNTIITGTGTDSGLLDKDGNDIFAGSFAYLAQKMNSGETADALYRDILERMFNNPAGGSLVLSRVRGDSGEIGLKCGTAEEPFGLINVGDAKGLCDHVDAVATNLELIDSEFSETMFAGVKESNSPINLLIGSKKFVEGWDCWRVSTMGLMHVGKSEGSQIIQLFGRGVRLKGWKWSLKAADIHSPQRPTFIEDLETLNVFGIEADFMERFREFLREEGLPGNERKQAFTVPLNVTYDFGTKLKILRPKRKASDGREYEFKRDAPVPQVGEVPEYLQKNRIISDWYPRIQAVRSAGDPEAGQRNEGVLADRHLALLDFDALYFEAERYKRERVFHNLNITKEGILSILSDASWYRVKIPPARLEGRDYTDVRLWQLVAEELVKRYCDRLYNYRKSEFIEPRLEYRELTREDDNFPIEDEYQLIVDGTEEQVIQSVKQVQKELEEHKDELLHVGDLCATRFGSHLYQPLFHVRRGGKIKIMPVSLNESEYQFVKDLVEHCQANRTELEKEGVELFLLRNMSRGRGIGFFEARNFYPDFILWLLKGSKQYVTFVEPHGLLREGPGSPKIQFHQTIKHVEARLADPDVILNSYIVSWTPHGQLLWGLSQEEMERQHVLFMIEDRDNYIRKLLTGIRAQNPVESSEVL